MNAWLCVCAQRDSIQERSSQLAAEDIK